MECLLLSLYKSYCIENFVVCYGFGAPFRCVYNIFLGGASNVGNGI